MDDLIKRDDALKNCILREDNPPTEMQLSLRNVISALPAVDRIEELETKLTKAVEALRECQAEIDQYIWQEYPSDHPVHERYRKRDLSANPARAALAELEKSNV